MKVITRDRFSSVDDFVGRKKGSGSSCFGGKSYARRGPSFLPLVLINKMSTSSQFATEKANGKRHMRSLTIYLFSVTRRSSCRSSRQRRLFGLMENKKPPKLRHLSKKFTTYQIAMSS
ncbi:hypothetical protein YC2023_096067 [Brassica napus]